MRFTLSVKSNYTCLFRTSDDVFSPDDYKSLLQFVYSSQRPLAATAGELLFSRYVDLHQVEQEAKKPKCRITFFLTMMLFFRLLSSVASDTQDEVNDEEADRQQTFARLKSLLQFYQDSEVGTLLF